MIRTVECRFKILRNGADFGELYALQSGTPTLRMNDGGGIMTSLTGTFAIPDEIDWLSDEIRPELWIDGTAYPLGIYLPATVREQENASTRSVTVDAFDRGWVLRDHYAEAHVFFPADAEYLETINSLLSAAGLSNVVWTPSAATLAEAREWPVGTSYLEIVNQLLSEINYNPIWFNAQGVAVLEPATVPTAINIDHMLDNETVQSLLLPQLSRETDVYQTPNVIIALCANPDKSADLVATSENTNPESPLSIVRRGRRICRLVRVDNIASQAELQAYADRLRDETMFTGETITVQTALLPGFGVADVTALHYGEIAAICIEHSWTMELRSGGTMTHGLERVVTTT